MKRSIKGFTLVEIMIVVAIIGILIAIAVPGFIKARNTSRRNACQENQTKIDGAVQQYILEENLNALADTPFQGSAFAAGSAGATALVGSANYLKAVPVCPSGGVYSFLAQEGSLGETVSCSIADHPFPSGAANGGNT
ncbi:MAG: prepilin-type N-terminal cleavage/methylation domain-containing protein [Candidatus Sumerlaeia bacterium]|nr:prepilin-type N-terminal cleavage/methylation domain-containing protein [Candidatus Sumerlaeia bacterium]